MSTALKQHPQSRVTANGSVYRFTVAQYHRMIRSGILTEDDRVELLDGWVVKKMAHNPPHDSAIARIQRRLATQLGEGWLIRVQSAITTKDSEPEPDLVVVTGPEEEYDTRHPTGGDIALVIEVADSSVDLDRDLKGPIYARARIPIYWVVNLPARQIEVYTRPRAGKSPAYRQRTDYAANQAVPLVVGNKVVAHLPVQPLLPKLPPDEQVDS
jgi:Uma2 family endonuclease